MKTIINKITTLSLGTVLIFASCTKDYKNPNAASQPDVFASPKGITGVAVSLQRTYSLTVHSSMMSSCALSTNEALIVNVGNVSEALLFNGGASVDGNNGLIGNVWISNCKLIYDANTVIDAAVKNIPDAAYRSGVIGYASIFKALGYGNLSMYWENVPDTIGAPVSSPSIFITRTQGYTKAVATIDRALAFITANPISTTFTSDIPAGIDIVNTLQALKARYALYAGNIAAAAAAASIVDITKISLLNYDALNPNPVFITVTSSNNVYQPIDSTLGLPLTLRPDLTDARIPFYTTIATSTPRYRMNGFWNSSTRSIPIYLPDEVRLIRAECLLRQSSPDAAAAKTIIDAILQQTPASDPLGVGANIVAGYTGIVDVPSLLNEVYRNRCIELFMSTNKMEDIRRFGRPNSETKRKNFPYPFRERDNNPNTPTDPVF
jgi:hypothetical protein